MDYIKIKGLSKDEVKGLVKEWLKLYPHSFNPEVNFWFYETTDNQIVVGLHDDLSTLAVSLLVIYLNSAKEQNGETKDVDVAAFVTVSDNEILLKQNYGRRAKIYAKGLEGDNTSVILLLENNYCVEYRFKGHAKQIKNSGLVFEEPEISVPDEKDEVVVGDVVPKTNVVEESLSPEASPLKKLMWYTICGAVGLAIGFLLVYFYYWKGN